MALIGIDFETKSRVDLIKHGAAKYFADKMADIVFLSYKIDDANTKIWFPHEELPDFIRYPHDCKFYAFNAIFEYRAWNILGTKYGYGKIDLCNLNDIMAICGRFAYPQKLEAAGEVLKLKMQKDKRGKYLINRICCPPFEYTHAEFKEFMSYGIRDVDSMYEMMCTLPATKLSNKEQRIWEVTQEINLKGLPIDVPAVTQILKVTEAYKLEQNDLLPSITGGNVTRATQTQRIKNWINRQGIIKLSNLQAKTVEDTLEKVLPKKEQTQQVQDISLVLQLRQELGKSSTAKYKKLLDQEHNSRIYDNLRYAGANTLRWAGMGFQLHNLPRSKVKDAQPIIDQFYDLSAIDSNPIALAKSIVRGMICAPEGKRLLFYDYSSIENRVLAWLANDQVTIELFKQGLDQYIDMAAYLFGVPYDKVTDEQRQFGKALILGCGYGLGHVGFQESAEGFGINLTISQSKSAVMAYRTRYNRVVKLWYACKDAAINAITYPGKEFTVHLLKFKVVKDKHSRKWLRMMLPSGRPIYYNDPEIGEGKFGAEPNAMGINPYSKKWMRMKIIPGRFVENADQAIARDILADAKVKLFDCGYDLIGSVHDEVIIEVPELEDYTKMEADVKHIMCTSSCWIGNLPLNAEGVVEKRYRKM